MTPFLGTESTPLELQMPQQLVHKVGNRGCLLRRLYGQGEDKSGQGN
jgi:hypothetical protein